MTAKCSALSRSDRNLLWMESLKSLFPQEEEFGRACAIYSFEGARDDGLTPQQAYDDFDKWTTEE